MVKRLKTRNFARWARRAGVADESLVRAAVELENGLYAAQLGAGLYKLRIAGQSRGKNSGFRTIVAYKVHDMHVWFARTRGDRPIVAVAFARFL